MTPGPPRAALGFGLVAALALGGVAAALVSQHVYDMQPCAWCVLQRLIYLVIAFVALIGVAWRTRLGARIVSGGVVLLAAAGAASALWQQFVAASSEACRLTLAERIVYGLKLDALAPEVFFARASCAEASVAMMGVPYALWSLALFVLLGAVAWGAARGGARR